MTFSSVHDLGAINGWRGQMVPMVYRVHTSAQPLGGLNKHL